ncbi:MAG TPA: hypothetical protein VJ725_27365 [Thermoanaerobaculia bacterium]|nr:hypothetical protein [Thermoanaerobaculia bacterium]
MAENIWSVLCYKASLDQDNNQVSLLDILEELTLVPGQEISSRERIGLGHHMEFVTLWRRTAVEKPETARMKLEILSPGNKNLGTAELEINLETVRRYRGIIKLDMLPFDGFGVYQFRLSKKDEGLVDWEEVARVPLEVNEKPSAAGSEKGARPPRRNPRKPRP